MLGFSLSQEQQMLVETARRFAREEIAPRAALCDRESKFPHEVYKKALEIGLVAPEIPSEYGGAGLGVLENCLIIAEMNWACSGIATSIAVSSLAATPLILAGSEEQKQKYLGMVARDGAY